MYGVHPRDTLMDLDASLGGGVLLTTSFVQLDPPVVSRLRALSYPVYSGPTPPTIAPPPTDGR